MELSANYIEIDLGLPSGTIWLDRNVGSDSPYEGGLYFSWADAHGYSLDHIPFNHEDYHSGMYNKEDKTYHLKHDDDPATMLIGDDYCLPTQEQIQELISPNNTKHEWSVIEGSIGVLFTSLKNDNTLFFPAIGYCDMGKNFYMGKDGYYWSSDVYSANMDTSYALYFNDKLVELVSLYRFYGFNCRGVKNNTKNRDSHPITDIFFQFG